MHLIGLSQTQLYWSLAHSPFWFYLPMQLTMGSPLFFSLDLCAAFDTIDDTILLNRLTSSFSIMYSLTAASSLISPTGHFSHFWLNFLFHLTFIFRCSPKLCLGFHNAHCFNYTFSRWQWTHSFLYSFPMHLCLAVFAAFVSFLHSWFLHTELF